MAELAVLKDVTRDLESLVELLHNPKLAHVAYGDTGSGSISVVVILGEVPSETDIQDKLRYEAIVNAQLRAEYRLSMEEKSLIQALQDLYCEIKSQISQKVLIGEIEQLRLKLLRLIDHRLNDMQI